MTYIYVLNPKINSVSTLGTFDTYKVSSVDGYYLVQKISVDELPIAIKKGYKTLAFEKDDKFYDQLTLPCKNLWDEIISQLPTTERWYKVEKVYKNNWLNGMAKRNLQPFEVVYSVKATSHKIIGSAFTRILHHFEDPESSFCIISACRDSKPGEDDGLHLSTENKKRSKQLEADIRKLGYGYISVVGGYVEEGNGTVVEKSYLVPHITKKEAIYLCKKYNQDAVLFKDEDGVRYLNKNGGVEMRFSNKLSLSKKDVEKYFSRLYKGSQSWIKFGFI